MARGPSSSSGEHSTSTMVSLVNRSNNGEEDHDDQPRTDWRSIYFITVICIMDAMKISAVMANSWPYLTSVDSQADEEFFGLSKSAFTLGAIVASLLSGWLSNRISHTKPPILAGQLLSSLCCLFYANLELIPRNRRYGFLISEILFGVSTGAISTWRVHIAMSSTDADRSKATSLIGFAINLGFVLAPMVVLLLGYLLAQGIRLPWGSQFNIFTAPIYLMSLLSLSGAILLFFCFDGQMHQLHPASRGEKVGKQLPTEKSPLEMTVPIEGQIPASEDQKSAAWSSRPDFAAILACFCARFCFMAFILYLMALSAPYSMSVFGWTGKQAVTYVMLSQSVMGLMGLLVCLGYTLRLLSRFKERFCVLAALLLMLAFFLASFPWPFLSGRLPEPTFETRIVNGTSMESLVSHGCDRRKYDWCERTPAINIVVYHVALILCLGLAMPVGQLNLDVLYSRLLGPIKQGTMQGLFVAVGDLVSLCGPLLITAVYQFKGSRPIWLGEIFVFGLGIAIWLCCYSRLVPNNYNNNYAPVAPVVDSAAVEADNEWNEATNVLRRQTSTVQSSEKQLLKE